MVVPSAINPLKYIIERQFNDKVKIKNKLFNERLSRARNLYRKDLFAHYGCVNAIEFSAAGELLVSGGDDRRVLLWSVPEAIYDKGAPVAMRTTHGSNIFCVAFDSRNEKIFSGGNDDQVLIHDIYTCNLISTIAHRKPVNGLSVNPQNDNVIATAGDDGRLLLYDIREPTSQEAQVLVKRKTGFHSVMFNPTNPHLLVSANSEAGIALWDTRKPEDEAVCYDWDCGKISGISASFDSTGKRVLALRRRLPPVLYETHSDRSICQFYHPQYYNSCTMKTCCFAGDNDEYVLSGSDDFNLYMWGIPQDGSVWGTSHIVLKGHRSIVNQVRYNKHNNLMASSGVEKMVKLWSTIPIGTWKGSLLREHGDPARIVYSQDDYLNLIGHTGERITHDYSDQSTLEDAKMMAFFDTLIQREIEGWDPNADYKFKYDSDELEYPDMIAQMYRNGRNSSLDDMKKHKANKIAQLISKKRKSLAKLAYNKSTVSFTRQNYKEQFRKLAVKYDRKSSHSSNGTVKRKHSSKHTTSQSWSKQSKTNHNNTVECSSGRSSRYRTRSSTRDIFDVSESSSSSFIDTPSTSTGITGSGNPIFRVKVDQDSDDETPSTGTNVVSERNEADVAAADDVPGDLVNIIPTPLNGSHDTLMNILEMAENNNSLNNDTNNHQDEEYDGASTSGSSGEHRQQHLKLNTRQFHAGSSNSNNQYISATYTNGDSDSDSDFEDDYRTPTKKRLVTVNSGDSGCVTGPCSSSSVKGSRPQRYEHDRSSDDEYKYEKFRKRVKKAIVNIRKQIGGDSDSN